MQGPGRKQVLGFPQPRRPPPFPGDRAEGEEGRVPAVRLGSSYQGLESSGMVFSRLVSHFRRARSGGLTEELQLAK